MEVKQIREVQVNYGPKSQYVGIKGPEDVVKFIRGILPNNSQEHCIVLYLDGSHDVQAYAVVSSGAINSSVLDARLVFQRAMLLGACAVVLAHNHPSGSTLPSDEDKAITKRLAECGKLLACKVLDHIIITDNDYRSLQEYCI